MIALVALVGVTLALTTVAMTSDPLEPYYSAAVRAMAHHWHDFVYAAADQDASVSVDKLPGALWLQAMSVRILGFTTLAQVLPAVLAAVVTIVAVFRTVHLVAGERAGLLATAVVATTPAFTFVMRGNIPDSIMIALLALAAESVVFAALSGRRRRLIGAAAWVGAAFEVKMAPAWIALPALAIGFVILAPLPWTAIIGRLASAGAVTAIVSLAWPIAVTLMPRAGRPWVDGTTDDSALSQTFGYNGFGRTGTATPNEILERQGLDLSLPQSSTGFERLFTGELGAEIGWLLPLCVILVVIFTVQSVRERSWGPDRGLWVMWAVWLVSYGVLFSALREVNSYYVAVMAPAIGALVGSAVVRVTGRVSRAALGALALAPGVWLILGADDYRPGTIVAFTVGAVIIGACGVALTAIAARWPRAGRIGAAGVLILIVAALVPGALTSASAAIRRSSTLDVPLETSVAAATVRATFVATPASVRPIIDQMAAADPRASVLIAVQSAAAASIFAVSTDREILPIGGYDGVGEQLSPTTLRHLVADGTVRVVLLLPNSTDSRAQWIRHTCRPLDSGQHEPLATYACAPETNRGPAGSGR